MINDKVQSNQIKERKRKTSNKKKKKKKKKEKRKKKKEKTNETHFNEEILINKEVIQLNVAVHRVRLVQRLQRLCGVQKKAYDKLPPIIPPS
jgi:ribosomal protein S25